MIIVPQRGGCLLLELRKSGRQAARTTRQTREPAAGLAQHVAKLRPAQRVADTGNYTLIHGKAPQGLAHWPDPDAVFVGGSGGELAALIPLLLSRLKAHGTLVMNFVCLENLALAMTALKAADAYWDVTQIQTARSRPLLDMHRLAAETPVWVVVATKADSEPPQL